MADTLNENITTQPPEENADNKSFSQEELNNIVRARLRRQADQYEQKLAQVQQTESVPVQSASAPDASNNVPAGAPNSGLNPDMMRAMMQEELRRNAEAAAQQKQKADAEQALAYHQHVISQLSSEDEDFKNLTSPEGNKTGLNIPGEIAVSLTNRLKPEHAKKVITDLLSNDLLNAKAKNALYEGSYDQWLNKLLSQAPVENKTVGKPVPDLTSAGTTPENDTDADMSNLENYLK